MTFNYGKGDKNPMKHVYFYTKSEPDKPIEIAKEKVSWLLPEIFQEQYVRLYTKMDDPEMRKSLKLAFSEWCNEQNKEENKYPVPIGM